MLDKRKLKKRTMKKILLFTTSLGIILGACRQSPNPSSQNDLDQIKKEKLDTALANGNDNIFATNAAIGSMMEVESSALMIKRTENRDIQNLATIMVKDHTMAQKELKSIALDGNIRLPQSLPDEKKAILAKLDSLKEDERNYYYAELMVKEHQEAVKLFRDAGNNESNIKLAQFAKTKLPTLEHHLMEAQNVFKIMISIRGDKGDFPLKTSKNKSNP